MNHDIVVVNKIRVRVDSAGRYNLNDLHKAAMENGTATESQRPGAFLQSESVQKFVQELTDAIKIASVVSVRGGVNQGSWGHEMVVTRYAAWIEPKFEIQIYQTFVNVKRAVEDFRVARNASRQLFPSAMVSLEQARESRGKTTERHHYMNESNMFNKIVLGNTAKKHRELHNFDPNMQFRDQLTATQNADIAELEQADSVLLKIGITDFNERKNKLTALFESMHRQRINN